MALFDGPLSDVAEDDLQALVTNQAAESRILDYKRDAIGVADRDRQEFLADVASFANAAGGHLVLGMEESGGLPSGLVGCKIDPDAEILRLEQMMRTGIRPVVQGIETTAIRLTTGGSAIVIRIPRSWRAPHQVGPVGSYRIFGRGSNGKYQLDVDELRTLFQQGPELAERVRAFRQERLLRILGRETPVPLVDGAMLILHLVPIEPFATHTLVDLGPVDRNHGLPISLLEAGGRLRINVDGRLTFTPMLDGDAHGCAQLYRNGTIEIVERMPPWVPNGIPYLPGTSFDEMVRHILRASCQLYNALDVNAPVAALLTLAGMRGWRMGVAGRASSDSEIFDRDPTICPDITIETLNPDVDIAQPIVDVAWSAAGFKQSMNYDRQGNWSPRTS